ncbi:MAG TPA: DegT/DnrJ/EryC1/StrS family aminotransferase [Acidisarcina sp.]
MRDGNESGKPLLEPVAGGPAIPMLDLSREYQLLKPELLSATERVLNAQNFILGHQVAEFEEAAAQFCQTGHAIGCSSGTDALWLSLAAAAIGPDDAVVTTPFTFFATASSILRTGARPLFADIDPRSLNLDPACAERLLKQDAEGLEAVRGRIKAVMPVHLYGQVGEWDRFEALRDKFNVCLIEDAAQSFGAAWDGRPAGSLGDLAAFSFYPTKNLSACGDAGMVTTGDARLAERLKMLRAHGMRRRYHHDEVGWNCRLDTLQAALLLVKIKYVADRNRRRQTLANRYDELFKAEGLVESSPYPSHGLVLPWTHPRSSHVFHQYVIRVLRRNALLAYLEARRIGSEVYYPLPLHLQESLLNLGYRRGDFPESERAADEVLALPVFPELRFEEQEVIVKAIAGFLS